MTDINQNKSRRDLLRSAMTVLPAGIAVWATTKAFGAGTPAAAAKTAAPAGKPAAGALKWIAESDPTAKALKYVADASTAKREKRGTTEGKDQNCSNCQLYTKQGEIDGKEAGKCLMLQNGSVAATGWCASWVKKA